MSAVVPSILVDIYGCCKFARQCLENLRFGPCEVKCPHLPKVRSSEPSSELADQVTGKLFYQLFAVFGALLSALFRASRCAARSPSRSPS